MKSYRLRSIYHFNNGYIIMPQMAFWQNKCCHYYMGKGIGGCTFSQYRVISKIAPLAT